MKKYYIFFLCSIALLSFLTKENYTIQYPNYFPAPAYNFKKRPLNSATIDLGKALFYDPILSADSSISCASCHSPFNAFAHTDHNVSHGIFDSMGTRNAPALFNLAWSKHFMWDGAVHNIEVQALAPINHPKEMSESTKNVVRKINNKAIYKKLLLNAFNDSVATGERVLIALAQFQLTLISANAKYDKVKQGLSTFTAQELNGYAIFKANCNNCHTEPLFTNGNFENNGLSVNAIFNDFGRWIVTKQPKDSLKFKVPTLRNLSYTYPYMHDGRYKNLREVLNHYTSSIVYTPTLSKTLQKNITINDKNKTDLIAFLLTLNDSQFVFHKNNHFPKNILLKN